MKLLFRRNQRSGLLGKVIFTLEVRADISAEERAAVSKYGLGTTMLYQSHEMVNRGSGALGLASRLAFKAMTINVSVNHLANGQKIECKDIVQMLAVEDQIKEAARTFAQVLSAAASFGGEEVVEL
jgi:hypothetical protein